MWDLCGWLGEVGGHLGNFSQSQKYLWLYQDIYKTSSNRIWDQLSHLFFLLLVTLNHLLLLLFQIFLCWNFLQHIISLAIKVCFLSFYICSSCFVEENRLMNMWYLRYNFLCMNSCLFMFNWYELREKWKHDPEFENKRNRTPWIRFCSDFLDLIQLCLHFSDIFPR